MGYTNKKCPPKRHFTGETLKFHQFVRRNRASAGENSLTMKSEKHEPRKELNNSLYESFKNNIGNHLTANWQRFYVRESYRHPDYPAKLQENGSSRATIETDEERTYFLIDIPRNPDCLGLPFVKYDKKDDKKKLSDIQDIIISFISKNDKITIPELTRKVEVPKVLFLEK